MRSTRNSSDNVASQSSEGMVNMNDRICSFESLKPTIQQPSFISNNIFYAVYVLSREKSFEVLSPLSVKVMRYREMV